MRRRSLYPFFLVILLVVMIGLGKSAAHYSIETTGIQQDSDGRKYMAGVAHPQKQQELNSETATGSDAFGYVWDTTVPLNWIDATTGTDTGMSGYSGWQSVGPIQLPFSFDFYEFSHSQLWINAGGYLAFSDRDARTGGAFGGSFPNQDLPNGIISPLWSEYTLAENGSANRVYYRNGGIAPNRYFVAQWHQVEFRYPPRDGDTIFEYQVVLHENGDITFQYLDLITNGGYWCDRVTTGMEDSRGLNGFTVTEWCRIPDAWSAIQITRPADAARVQLLQPYQGEFTNSHANIVTQIDLVNNGTLGPDTYNLTSNSGWPVNYYDIGGNELGDTNGDTIVDTGPVNQGAEKTVIAKVQSPTAVNPNDENHFINTLTSIRDSSTKAEAHVQLAVPAPFAQAYYEMDKGIYLVKPDERNAVSVSDQLGWGWDMAVAETPTGGFLYVGESSRRLGEDQAIGVSEISYTGLDSKGNKRYPVKKLIDHSSATIDTYDSNAAVAVAPNGTAGIVWYRWLIDQDGRRNHNIYFAALNQAGGISYGPVRVTENDIFGEWQALNVPASSSPSIAATSDNRFMLSWTTAYDAAQGDTVSNVEYMVKGSDGSTVKPVTRLTNDLPGEEKAFGSTGLVSLDNGQAGLAYVGGVSWDQVLFTVLDSNGQVVKNPVLVATGGMNSGRPDIAQFANGNTMIAWSNRNTNGTVSHYAVLDTQLGHVAGPNTLSHPAMHVYGPGSTRISLAAASTGQVVATWMDPDWDVADNLYYAALNNDGSIETPPMIFRNSPGTVMTGMQGYGNTTLTLKPSVAGVDAYIAADENVFASPDGSAAIPLKFGNAGSSEATSLEVSVTLSDDMQYVGDSSGIIPTETLVTANSVTTATYTWNIPTSLDYLGNGRFTIYVSLEGDVLEEVNPLALEVATAEIDGNPSNNNVAVNVLVWEQALLPVIIH